MLKITGCILLFISCSALGFLKASSYKARRRELESALELVRLLNLEISYRKDPLQKTFQKVAALKECWFSDVLRECAFHLMKQEPLQRSWKGALNAGERPCPLLPGDVAVLEDLSLGLGKSDTRGQKEIFEPAMLRLAECLQQAQDQERKQGKMYRSLGVSAGVV
ncbi:MAG: stage III sporulation protein AB, partial [Bacillota bacterium]|nr:stage III sporulation protein AB [Bacillota bacterium]